MICYLLLIFSFFSYFSFSTNIEEENQIASVKEFLQQNLELSENTDSSIINLNGDFRFVGSNLIHISKPITYNSINKSKSYNTYNLLVFGKSNSTYLLKSGKFELQVKTDTLNETTAFKTFLSSENGRDNNENSIYLLFESKHETADIYYIYKLEITRKENVANINFIQQDFFKFSNCFFSPNNKKPNLFLHLKSKNYSTNEDELTLGSDYCKEDIELINLFDKNIDLLEQINQDLSHENQGHLSTLKTKINSIKKFSISQETYNNLIKEHLPSGGYENFFKFLGIEDDIYNENKKDNLSSMITEYNNKLAEYEKNTLLMDKFKENRKNIEKCKDFLWFYLVQNKYFKLTGKINNLLKNDFSKFEEDNTIVLNDDHNVYFKNKICSLNLTGLDNDAFYENFIKKINSLR